MKSDNLTLREKIGQTMIMLCTPEKHIREFGSLENFLKKYPIGGIYPSGDLQKGIMKSVLSEEYKKTIKEYNKYLKVPLIAAGDGVNDNDDQIVFEINMSIGAANDVDLAYDYGKVFGNQVKAGGLNWLFSPVVHLNISQDSPITNVRSLSDDPNRAIPLAKAIIKGIQDTGVAATAKHYPGTDDKEKIDPHLAPVNNSISKETWWNTTGKVYKELSENNLMSVMTGHVNLPSLQSYKIDGRYPSATMSEELVSGLLKKEIGFNGVVVTDALVMGGFVGRSGIDNQIESLKAGNDVLLWPGLEYMDLLEKKILSGEFPEERLNDAVEKILTLKEQTGVLDKKNKEQENYIYDAEFAKKIFDKIAEKSITVVQDENKLLSADKSKLKRILVIGVTPDDACFEDLCQLKKAFLKYNIDVDIKRDIWKDEIEAIEDNYDFTIFALCRFTHRPIGPLDFWGDNASSIWASQASDMKKTLVVSFGNPYSYKYYSETDMTYINAYSSSVSTINGFVRGFLGEFEFNGTSPVKLI